MAGVAEIFSGVFHVMGFASDIWLYICLNKEMPSVGESVITNPGPGSSILLLALSSYPFFLCFI